MHKPTIFPEVDQFVSCTHFSDPVANQLGVRPEQVDILPDELDDIAQTTRLGGDSAQVVNLAAIFRSGGTGFQ